MFIFSAIFTHRATREFLYFFFFFLGLILIIVAILAKGHADAALGTSVPEILKNLTPAEQCILGQKFSE